MKTIILLFLLLSIPPMARAGVVTLIAKGQDTLTGTNGIAELRLGPYEWAEVVSFPTSTTSGQRLEIEKDGLMAIVSPGICDAVSVAGPANIRLVAERGQQTAMCTIKVRPEAFPPDKALLLSPGTNQARITLECSTNLVQWFSATNGVYGPLPEAKFFRIRLEPVP